jgi:hypothetical protein
MKNLCLTAFGLWVLSTSCAAYSGELCEKNNLEFVMEEARRYNHLAKDILFKYDYNAKELLAQQPTPSMDQCLKQHLQPIIDDERAIVSNKDYEDMASCEKYEQISVNAKIFIRKYSSLQKTYFQTCLNNNPSE